MDRNNPGRGENREQHVALRKESVDRNLADNIKGETPTVALRKESVDRNKAALVDEFAGTRRSPQGERG